MQCSYVRLRPNRYRGTAGTGPKRAMMGNLTLGTGLEGSTDLGGTRHSFVLTMDEDQASPLFLPSAEGLTEAIARIGRFKGRMRARARSKDV